MEIAETNNLRFIKDYVDNGILCRIFKEKDTGSLLIYIIKGSDEVETITIYPELFEVIGKLMIDEALSKNKTNG